MRSTYDIEVNERGDWIVRFSLRGGPSKVVQLGSCAARTQAEGMRIAHEWVRQDRELRRRAINEGFSGKRSVLPRRKVQVPL